MPLFASAMAAGVLSGAFVPTFAFVLAASLAGTAVISLSFFFRPRLLRIACAAFAFFALGAGLASWQMARGGRLSVALDGRAMVCDGRVLAPPIPRRFGVSVDVRLLSCGVSGDFSPARGRVRLSMKEEEAQLLPGEEIRFRAIFFPARDFKNPGSFSYRRYLAVHGIGATGRAFGKLERTREASGIGALVERLRRRVASSIASALDPPSRGVVEAMAIGNQRAVDPGLREDFADAGLAHILAISGLNVAYVAALIYLLARLFLGRFPWLLRRVPLRQLAAAATAPAVWGYVLFTGGAIPAIRAALMMTVLLMGVLAFRRQDPLSTLAAAVAAVLAFLPLSVLDVSFQLSVVAVLGMVLLVPRMAGRAAKEEGWLRRAGRWIWLAFAVTLAATLFTAPIVAYHFKFVSPVGLVANIVAVPLAGWLTPLVAVASAVAAASPVAAWWIWKGAGVGAALLISLTERAADAGAPFILRWAPGMFEMVLAYALLGLVVFWKGLPYRRFAAAVVAALVIFAAVEAPVRRLLHPGLSVTVLDVGQGDATLVRFPDGRALLIDGGGIPGSDFDVGKNVVAPALWRMGVRRLDWILLTHPHHDHYRGLGFIAAHFHPEFLWTNGRAAPDAEEAEWKGFLGKLDRAKVPLARVGPEGAAFDSGGASVRIFPVPSSSGEFNDSSLVADVRFGAHRFLFMGDLSREGEAALLRRGDELKAHVLKVGHHGSADATGEPFLERVRPAIALISAGERNRYGVPARETIERLLKAGARILRTDRDGAITVVSDGSALDVASFVGGPEPGVAAGQGL